MENKFKPGVLIKTSTKTPIKVFKSIIIMILISSSIGTSNGHQGQETASKMLPTNWYDLAKLQLPSQPVYLRDAEFSDQLIESIHLFSEPLVADARHPWSAKEAAALLTALAAYVEGGDPQLVAPLVDYRKAYPNGRYGLALDTNLGIIYWQVGYYQDALTTWEAAWKSGKSAPEPARQLSYRSVGELANLSARLGHYANLDRLFKEVEGHTILGIAGQKLMEAREGRERMRREPERSFLCGPYALLNLYQKWTGKHNTYLEERPSTRQGTTLAQLKAWSDHEKMDMVAVKRDLEKEEIPVDAVLHWRVNHFAAVLDRRDMNGQRYYKLIDPTFGEGRWIREDVIKKEASGYFLMRRQDANGVSPVLTAFAQRVSGRGAASSRNTDQQSCRVAGGGNNFFPPRTSGRTVEPLNTGYPFTGCASNMGGMFATHNLDKLKLDYSSFRTEGSMLSTAFNFGLSNWKLRDYGVTLTVNSAAPFVGAVLQDSDGIRRYNIGTDNISAPHREDNTRLVWDSVTNSYFLKKENGIRLIFGAPQLMGTEVRYRLDEITYPTGETGVGLIYDNQGRLTTIEDRKYNKTLYILQYADAANPTRVTRIVNGRDLGRTVDIGYDLQGRLTGVTDALGNKTTYGYSNTTAQIVSISAPNPQNPQTQSVFTISYLSADNLNAGVTFTGPGGEPLGTVAYTKNPPTGTTITRPSLTGPEFIQMGEPMTMSAGGGYTYLMSPAFEDYYRYHGLNTKYSRAPTLSLFKTDNFQISNEVMSACEGVNCTFSIPGTPDEVGMYQNYVLRNDVQNPKRKGPSKFNMKLPNGAIDSLDVIYNSENQVIKTKTTEGEEIFIEYHPQFINKPIRVDYKNCTACPTTSVTATYTPSGQIAKRVEGNGDTTEFFYDEQHQHIETRTPGGSTFFAHNADGDVIEVKAVDRSGTVLSRSEYAYTPSGEEALNTNYRTNGAPDAIQRTYDFLGRESRIDFSGGSYRLLNYSGYFLKDRLTYAPDGALLSREGIERDAMGRIIRVERIANGVAELESYEYGPAGIKRIKNNAGNTVWQADQFDPQGNVITSTLGGVTTTAYKDSYGRPAVEYRPESGRRFEYDSEGRLYRIQKTGANEFVNNYFYYDSQSRLAQFWGELGTESYSYRTTGSVLEQQQVARTEGPFPGQVTTYYEETLSDGRRSRRVHQEPGGYDLQKIYNLNGCIESETTPLGTTNYYYDPVIKEGCKVIEIIRPAHRSVYVYDTRGRPLTISHQKLDGSSLLRFAYEFDPTLLKINSFSYQFAGESEVREGYLYDVKGRLIEVAGAFPEQYSYDLSNNLMAMAPKNGGQVVNFAYDQHNKMASINSMAVTSDGEGNTKGIPEGVIGGLNLTYTFNRVKTLSSPTRPGELITFKYHAGRLADSMRTQNGQLIEHSRYLWCNPQDLTPCQEFDVLSQRITRQFYPGLEHLPATQTTYYYLDDIKGSVWAGLNAGRNEIESRQVYSPWGEKISQSGLSLAIGYSGYFRVADAPIYHTLNREYYPEIARFLEPDPAGLVDGPNIYAYAGNDPVNSKDPSGLSSYVQFGVNCFDGLIKPGNPMLFDLLRLNFLVTIEKLGQCVRDYACERVNETPGKPNIFKYMEKDLYKAFKEITSFLYNLVIDNDKRDHDLIKPQNHTLIEVRCIPAYAWPYEDRCFHSEYFRGDKFDGPKITISLNLGCLENESQRGQGLICRLAKALLGDLPFLRQRGLPGSLERYRFDSWVYELAKECLGCKSDDKFDTPGRGRILEAGFKQLR